MRELSDEELVRKYGECVEKLVMADDFKVTLGVGLVAFGCRVEMRKRGLLI